ncbi:hypothetical protein [Parabacteroides goldsteinii]|uniref:hypothetical protein n=1 Tax=Parabacteroides goldsteinii TaxID=328812 RepID=UPI003AEFE42E
MSNTPESALLYSAGNAPVKKSELPSTKLLNEVKPPPPKVVTSAKWLGLGISTSSNRHCNERGALPRTTMPLLPTLEETPANADTSLAGSSMPPA